MILLGQGFFGEFRTTKVSTDWCEGIYLLAGTASSFGMSMISVPRPKYIKTGYAPNTKLT